MFSIKKSRSRLKFKPPRVLVCSLLCLLTVSMIMLIAQLRAIELTPNNIITDLRKQQQQTNLTNIFTKHDQDESRTGSPAVTTDTTKILITNNTEKLPASTNLLTENSHGHGLVVQVHDNDDHSHRVQTATNYSEEFANQPTNLVEPAASISSPVLAIDGSNGEYVGPQTRPFAEPLAGLALPLASPSQDQMMQQATGQLIESLSGQKTEMFAPPGSLLEDGQRAGPSLAELTAAGTAAGLIMHDLMAQANMVEQLPFGQTGPWQNSANEMAPETGAGTNSDDDQEDDAPNSMPDGLNGQMLARQQQQQQQRLQERQDDEDDDGDRETTSRGTSMGGRQPLQSDADEDLGRTTDEQAMGRGGGGVPLQAHQTANQAASLETDASAPEPPDENQMPDSIESLMGADMGSDMDDSTSSGADSGGVQRSDQTEADEPPDDGQQQQFAGSHLYAQNNNDLPNNGLTPAQLQHQQLVAAQIDRRQNDEDGDYEDDADNSGNLNENQLQQASALNSLPSANNRVERRHYGMPNSASFSSPAFQAQPIVVAGNGMIPSGGAGNAIFRPEFEQNLVAPMRDSIVDLNAAAGHYYGKKKKKKKKIVKVKKKKIIIKKKKKKVKKYKVIKIKKKKKKKKKKKYVHHKKHHYPKKHHHDHGKYYMYAKVPKKKSWEFGFKKGNKKHWISRHEKGHKNKFKTKVMWYDKKSKGKGVHIWDYNHHDKKKKKHY